MKKFTLSMAALALTFSLAACGDQETATKEEKTAAQSTATSTEKEVETKEVEKTAANGYFEDADVQERPLSNWENKWQSVYPFLQDGTLDEVFEHKAKDGDKTVEEYKEYYEIGYKTDVTNIDITDKTITFYKGDDQVVGTYETDGYEILTYEKGNRGVRYIFKQVDKDSTAPKYVQFSDHIIKDETSHHFHIYMGDDRKALLEELENWPTYYPDTLSGHDIAHEMMAH